MCADGFPADLPVTGEPPLRVVITGKGGVGKTTLAATLTRVLARSGRAVLAVDADAQMNLARTLGLSRGDADAIVPLARNDDYTEEKVGARPGGSGLLLRLNPDATDAVDRFAVPGPDGSRLLVMGGLTTVAAGCLCPENALLAAAVGAVGRRTAEVVVMDTQAGVEHFGRALARGFSDAMVVTDSTSNAVSVAVETARLAELLGIPNVTLVINRVRGESDVLRTLRLVDAEGGFAFASVVGLPYDPLALECEPSVTPLFDAGSALPRAVAAFAGWLLPVAVPA